MTDPTPNPAAIRRRLAALSDLMNAGVALCNASRALVITSAADPDLQATIALATARSAIERALGQLDTGWTPPDLPPAAREFLDRGRPEREPLRAVSPVEYAVTDNDAETGWRVLFVDAVGDVCPRCGGSGIRRSVVGSPGSAAEWVTCGRCKGSGNARAPGPRPGLVGEFGEGDPLSGDEVRRAFSDEPEEGAA